MYFNQKLLAFNDKGQACYQVTERDLMIILQHYVNDPSLKDLYSY